MKKKKLKEALIHKEKYLVFIYWSSEDKAYVAEVPELTGCATHGDTFDEAANQAHDAIESWLEGAVEAGIEIPEPMTLKRYSGKFNLRIEPTLHKSLALKAVQKGKSLNRFVEEVLHMAV